MHDLSVVQDNITTSLFGLAGEGYRKSLFTPSIAITLIGPHLSDIIVPIGRRTFYPCDVLELICEISFMISHFYPAGPKGGSSR
jgi:hypothetical protein